MLHHESHTSPTDNARPLHPCTTQYGIVTQAHTKHLQTCLRRHRPCWRRGGLRWSSPSSTGSAARRCARLPAPAPLLSSRGVCVLYLCLCVCVCVCVLFEGGLGGWGLGGRCDRVHLTHVFAHCSCLSTFSHVHLLANTSNESTVYGVFAGLGRDVVGGGEGSYSGYVSP